MTVRNGADTIRETIVSVIAQTYQDWELLIRDNASTDETVGIIKAFNDPRIRLFLNTADRGGLYNCLLLQQCVQGEYLKQLDDDSYLYPECLEKQIQALLTRPDIAFVSCDTEYRTKSGKTIASKIPLKKDIITQNDYVKFNLLTARGSIQEGNQTLYRTALFKSAYDKYIALGWGGGLINIYSGYFFVPYGAMAGGDLYIIRETLSAGLMEADSLSLKYSQTKLQSAWIKLLRLDNYKINPFLYIWARIMIVVRSTARRMAFWILGR
jgi:glycosyltransferase involved in cell wall biosynthesis